MMSEYKQDEYPSIEQYAVQLRFICGQKLNTVDEVRQLAENLPRFGIQPAVRKEEQVVAVSDTKSVVDSSFIDFEAENRVSGGLLRGIMFPLKLVRLSEDNFAVLDWSQFDDGCNKVGIIVTVYGKLDRSAHDEMGDQVGTFAHYLYDVMRPAYGIVCDPDRESPSTLDDDATLQFPRLGWRTFFGPNYLDKYGAEMFHQMPGCESSSLSDGGMLLQSRPTLTITNVRAHKRWEQEYTAYLKLHGVTVR